MLVRWKYVTWPTSTVFLGVLGGVSTQTVAHMFVGNEGKERTTDSLHPRSRGVPFATVVGC